MRVPILILLGCGLVTAPTEFGSNSPQASSTASVEGAYTKVVRDADSNFDRFLSSILASSEADLQIFERISKIGRAFDELAVRNGMRTMKLSRDNRASTPFYEFADYTRDSKPAVVNDPWWRSIENSPRPKLAKSDRVVVKRLDRSILICQGETDDQFCVDSIIVGGGDVAIRTAISSMVFAAGDVTLAVGSKDSLVVAGGKIRIGGTVSGALLLVTPKKLEVAEKKFIKDQKIVVYDGKNKPVPELFHFPDLADYGLKAARDEGKVKVQIVKADSPFQKILNEGDVVLAAKKTKIESVAHFRRLMSHALDTGKLDLEVEREGKELAIKADVKKGERK